MLKWTASAQKVLPHATPTATALLAPCINESKRLRRRATIADKENLPATSTPMVMHQRNSSLGLGPLMDILNITPERSVPRTPERAPPTQRPTTAPRRRSTIGITLPSTASLGIYSSTLPLFEEEYSPSTELPTGQQLAMRGLLPDPFLGHPRYFASPEVTTVQKQPPSRKSMPQKRKLEQEFAAIAAAASTKKKPPDEAGLVSAKMGDQTLDKLIDAILHSARKEDKKKEKPRKSFNLRRRTLLKNQVQSVEQQLLSPSYTPADDPASDLNFLLAETSSVISVSATSSKLSVQQSAAPATPAPATPPPGTPLPEEVLRQLPTPLTDCSQPPQKNDSFMLATPVKKRHRKRPSPAPSATDSTAPSTAKRLKEDAQSYLEIGLALPSIYV